MDCDSIRFNYSLISGHLYWHVRLGNTAYTLEEFPKEQQIPDEVLCRGRILSVYTSIVVCFLWNEIWVGLLTASLPEIERKGFAISLQF